MTYRKVFPNLEYIKLNGIEPFVYLQRIRMDALADFLKQFDDGRSKSFYCLTCALLPNEKLNDCHRYMNLIDDSFDVKEKCRILKKYIQQVADDLKIDLKLNSKKDTIPKPT